jgi:hypothetical protein
MCHFFKHRTIINSLNGQLSLFIMLYGIKIKKFFKYLAKFDISLVNFFYHHYTEAGKSKKIKVLHVFYFLKIKNDSCILHSLTLISQQFW